MFAIDSDGISKMAYGTHPDILDEDPADDFVPPYGHQAGPVDNALVQGNRIRIVVDELLQGGTLEQFQCACFRTDGSGCATRGFQFEPGTTVDPTRCTTCGDDPVTLQINETGLCADVNFDGVADNAYFLPNVVGFDCGVAMYMAQEDDGWYTPSGNQLIPTFGGTSALGPAVVINPPLLPTNSTCTVVFDASVVDKDNNTVVADPETPGTPSFHTEPLAMIVNDPFDGQTGVALATDITLTFNVELDSTIGGAAVEVLDLGPDPLPMPPPAPVAVTGTLAIDPNDGASLIFTPDNLLTASHVFEVTAKAGATGVKDSFGSELPADVSFTFTTGTM